MTTVLALGQVSLNNVAEQLKARDFVLLQENWLRKLQFCRIKNIPCVISRVIVCSDLLELDKIQYNTIQQC